MNLPLSAPMAEESVLAEHELREAAALGREYGVLVIPRIVRTRNVGQAIVDEARRRRSEIIVLGRRAAQPRRRADVRPGDRLRAAKCRLPGDGRHPADRVTRCCCS